MITRPWYPLRERSSGRQGCQAWKGLQHARDMLTKGLDCVVSMFDDDGSHVADEVIVVD